MTKGARGKLPKNRKEGEFDGIFALYGLSSVNLFYKNSIDEVSLLCIDGKEVYPKKVQSDQTTLEINNLDDGMYFIKIKSADQVILKKFVQG